MNLTEISKKMVEDKMLFTPKIKFNGREFVSRSKRDTLLDQLRAAPEDKPGSIYHENSIPLVCMTDFKSVVQINRGRLSSNVVKKQPTWLNSANVTADDGYSLPRVLEQTNGGFVGTPGTPTPDQSPARTPPPTQTPLRIQSQPRAQPRAQPRTQHQPRPRQEARPRPEPRPRARHQPRTPHQPRTMMESLGLAPHTGRFTGRVKKCRCGCWFTPSPSYRGSSPTCITCLRSNHRRR